MANDERRLPEKLLYCSFCGKSQHEVRKLIAGPSVYICNECIELCNDIIREEGKKGKTTPAEGLPTPKEIVAMLDEYVVGQRRPKEVLAVAIRQHFMRLSQKGKAEDGVEMKKTNILLIGPSGAGKTFLAETLARILKVPFATEDLTAVTQAGYVGKDVTDVLGRLLSAADGDVSKAEFGIVFYDETDKLGRTQDPRTTPDVGGGGVQQALLKILEGTIAEVLPEGGRRVPGQELTKLNTKNILFIMAGAFEGLEKIIEKRINRDKGSMGFGANITSRLSGSAPLSLIHEVTTDDLIEFGMDRQLLGRLPCTATLDELDEDTLKRILTQPKNALLKQYKLCCANEGAEFIWDEPAVAEIARMAIAKKTGARGLETICTELLHDTFFNLPTHQQSGDKICAVHLTGEQVKKGLPPELIRERKDGAV